MRSRSFARLFIYIILVILMFQTSVYAWSAGTSSTSTHSMMLKYAIDMLPSREKNLVSINWTLAYQGAYAPDCGTTKYSWCIGDSDRPHDIFYYANRKLQDDSSALNAKDQYDLAIMYLSKGDMDNFSFRIGAMSHYIVDPGSFPHTMGSNTDWGDCPFDLHTSYESAVRQDSQAFDNVVSDGPMMITAYDAALKNGYESTFDDLDGGIYTNVWMRDNYNLADPWSVPGYENRVKKVINYDVNQLSDAIYTVIDTVYPGNSLPPPKIISSSPISSIQDVTPSTMIFNITVNQKVNTTWYLDGKVVKNSYGVTKDSYQGTVNIIGSHQVNMTAQNKNGTVTTKWNWNILGIYDLTTDKDSIYGLVGNVTFSVIRKCGIVSGDNCTVTSYLPVPSASISIKGNATGSGTTNVNGLANISINATKNGTIRVTASKPGFLDDNITIEAVMGTYNITTDTDTVFVGVNKNVTFSAMRGSEIPVSGVNIFIKGNATGNGKTGDNGQVVIPINATGTGTIMMTTSKYGYIGDNVNITIDAILSNFTVTADSNNVFVGIVKNITFKVNHNDSNISIPDVDIYIEGNAIGNGKTDDSGQVVIPINATGNGSINVIARKYGYLDNNIIIEADIYVPPINVGSGGSGGSGSGGSGGGGGGGGGASAEPYENILKYQVKENFVSKNPVIYSYTLPEIPVYELFVTGTQSEEVSIRIEVLKNKSRLANLSPPGNIYKNFNMWTNSKRLNNISIRFKVENSWMNQDQDIRLLGWDKNNWKELYTKVINKDDTYTYLESDSNLSTFAIVGLSAIVGPTLEKTETKTTILPKDTQSSIPVKESPGFNIVSTVMAIIVILVIEKNRRIR